MNELMEFHSAGTSRLAFCDDQGTKILTRFTFLSNARRNVLRIGTLALGAVSLSACAYGAGDYGGYGGVSVGVGSGYAGGYDPYCDGYSAYDSFYGCDAGLGFGQIGYGGGYWDNFYYPGFGTFIYDRPGGRRFAMQDRHRQYWGQQRFQYQQQRRGNRQDFRQGRRDDRQDYRQDRREDRREYRQDRREDRRDWRQGQQGQVTPADRQQRREWRQGQQGQATPVERQQRREMRQQRRQDMTGQPPQASPMRGEGRGRGGMRQLPPQPQAATPQASPRAERAPRAARQQRMERPTPNPRVSGRQGGRQENVRPD